MNLSNEDLKNALIFLNRVQITGEEGMALVEIQLKLRAEIKSRVEAAEPVAADQ